MLLFNVPPTVTIRQRLDRLWLTGCRMRMSEPDPAPRANLKPDVAVPAAAVVMVTKA